MAKIDLKNPRTRRILIIIAAIAVMVIGVWAWIAHGEESTDDAQIDAHVASIAANVSGYVVDMHITDNQHVKAGDVLLKIDPRDYQIALDHAQAALSAAVARQNAGGSTLSTTRISAPSNLASAQAELQSAQAQAQKAAADLKRLQSVDPLARSQEQLDAAIAGEKAARASVENAKAKLKSAQTVPQTVATAESNVKELQAAVEQAKADVAQAEKHLNDTVITAPFDGRIAQRGAELGNYVQPGQQLMSVVSDDYWVIANYKETQLRHMHAGQPATIRIDAFPGKHYKAHVDSIQHGSGAYFSAFPPENATGNFVKIVQRVPVKILFDEKPDATLPVGPGMSAQPVVDVR